MRTQCIQQGKVLVVVYLSILGWVLVNIDIAEHTEQWFTWEKCKIVMRMR